MTTVKQAININVIEHHPSPLASWCPTWTVTYRTSLDISDSGRTLNTVTCGTCWRSYHKTRCTSRSVATREAFQQATVAVNGGLTTWNLGDWQLAWMSESIDQPLTLLPFRLGEDPATTYSNSRPWSSRHRVHSCLQFVHTLCCNRWVDASMLLQHTVRVNTTTTCFNVHSLVRRHDSSRASRYG